MNANVARFLTEATAAAPERTAIVGPDRSSISYAALDRRSDAIAQGLLARGLHRGSLTLLMVRAGIDLISLTYACFKAGVVPVLIDPGMGLHAFLHAVEQTGADALIGIPQAHVLRLLARGRFRSIRHHVTVGRRLFWGGDSLEDIARAGAAAGPCLAQVEPGSRAAVLFTSGSTGPAKGVVYTHGMFSAQVDALHDIYGFRPGEVDLAAFPLFSLFDCALQMTSVIPDLDPSRPGTCDPARLFAAARDLRATTAFGSPAVWRRVAPWCLERGLTLPDLKRVIIAGASVPPGLIEQLHRVLAPGGDVVTPYGATEALPVSSISGREIVETTGARSRQGAGTCVGQVAPRMLVRIIRISDAPIPAWSDDLLVADGEVGEICVKGAVVTDAYHHHPEATTAAKIFEDGAVWHRMGDLGYLDRDGRLWFCGRKAERVETASGPLYTDMLEGVFGAHPGVGRCALVGVGPRGQERPVLVVEGAARPELARELRGLAPVEAVLFHPRFPVDVRHNAKIHRATLKTWAEGQLA